MRYSDDNPLQQGGPLSVIESSQHGGSVQLARGGDVRVDSEAEAVAGPEPPAATDRFTCRPCGATNWGRDLGRDAYGVPCCPDCGRTLPQLPAHFEYR